MEDNAEKRENVAINFCISVLSEKNIQIMNNLHASLNYFIPKIWSTSM